MIDTNKYEGHTPAPWLPTHDLVETEAKYGCKFTQVLNHDGWRVWVGEKDTDVPHLQNSRFGSENLGEADAQLIADAPLLLAEVKRLRVGISSILYSFECKSPDYDITELIRDVPEDEWNFEQQALVRMKELIE